MAEVWRVKDGGWVKVEQWFGFKLGQFQESRVEDKGWALGFQVEQELVIFVRSDDLWGLRKVVQELALQVVMLEGIAEIEKEEARRAVQTVEDFLRRHNE